MTIANLRKYEMNKKYPLAYKAGQQLKALRLQQGYTITNFAYLLNVSAQQLFRYERGVNRIDIDTLIRGLILLNVKLDEFFALLIAVDQDLKSKVD